MRSELPDGILQDAAGAQTPILCVDANRSSLEHLSASLRGAGFSTLTASDRETAIALCAQARPALAIVNYEISDGSGIELARHLQYGGSLPVLLVAADADYTLLNEAADAGALSVLVRPVELSHLLPTVRTALLWHLELQRLRQKLQRLESVKQTRHETGVVVGLLMERLQIPAREAFARLRRFARERNRKISDVAAEILRSADCLLSTTRQIGYAGGAAVSKGT